MCPKRSPSSITSSDIGGSRIRYFAFFIKGTSNSPPVLGLTYTGVQAIDTSLRFSIVGWLLLCHGDCRVEVLPANFVVFGGVFITVAIPQR